MIQVSGCACSKRRPSGCVLRTQKVGCHTETDLVSWVSLLLPHGLRFNLDKFGSEIIRAK